MSAKPRHLKLVKSTVMRPVTARRKAYDAYRVREHLTEAEMTKLLASLRQNRHGHRDWLIALLIYRHGLRVSEACDLRWDDIDLARRTIIVRRLKGSTDSTHYLERDELAGLKRLQRDGAKSARAHGNRPDDRAGRQSRQAAVPDTCAHDPALHWLRPGRQRHGHTPAPALPRPCQHHQHGALYRDVA